MGWWVPRREMSGPGSGFVRRVGTTAYGGIDFGCPSVSGYAVIQAALRADEDGPIKLGVRIADRCRACVEPEPRVPTRSRLSRRQERRRGFSAATEFETTS